MFHAEEPRRLCEGLRRRGVEPAGAGGRAAVSRCRRPLGRDRCVRKQRRRPGSNGVPSWLLCEPSRRARARHRVGACGRSRKRAAADRQQMRASAFPKAIARAARQPVSASALDAQVCFPLIPSARQSIERRRVENEASVPPRCRCDSCRRSIAEARSREDRQHRGAQVHLLSRDPRALEPSSGRSGMRKLLEILPRDSRWVVYITGPCS